MTEVKVIDRPLTAATTILVAMALLALTDNAVPRIAEDIGLWQFHAMRTVMALGLLGGLGALGWVRLGARRRWAVIARGGLTALAMLIYFGCLAFLPIGQVAAGLFSAPLWILLVGGLAFGHRVRRGPVLAAVLGFVGVLIVLNPLGEGVRLVSALPLMAGFFYGLAGLATREWCAEESPLAMLVWFFAALGLFGLAGLLGLWLVPVAAPEGAEGFILRGWVRPSAVALGLTAFQAVASLVAVGMIMRAYLLGQAAQVAVLEFAFIPFAALWAWMLWGQGVGLRDVAGIAVILGAGVMTAVLARRAGQ